jgi:hypothetical protein
VATQSQESSRIPQTEKIVWLPKAIGVTLQLLEKLGVTAMTGLVRSAKFLSASSI